MATQKNLIHTELLATDNTSVPVDRAAASIQKFDQAAQKANKGGLRLMRGGLGQLGHQVQDVAVQLQMGQNAMLVFGQQGSQIASLMGPNGAIIGAVLAVGAALATSFVPSVMGARDATKLLADAAEKAEKVFNPKFANSTLELADAFRELAKESETLAKNTLLQSLSTAMDAVEVTTKALDKSVENLTFNLAQFAATQRSDPVAALAANFDIGADKADELNQKIKAFRKGIEGSGPALTTFLNDLLEQKLRSGDSAIALGTASAEIINYVNELDRNNKIISTANGLLDTFNEELGKNPKAAKEAAKKIEQFADKLQSAFRKSTGLTSAQILGLELQTLKELEPAQADRLAGMIREMRQTEINEQAAKNAAEAEKKRNKELAEEDRAIAAARKEFLKSEDAANAILDAVQKKKDIRAKDVENLRSSMLSQQEVLAESLQKEMDLLTQFAADDVANEQLATELKIKAQEEYYSKVEELRKKSKNFEDKNATEKTKMVLDGLGEAFKGVQANNKKMFAVQKAYNIAQAIMSTYTGAAKALETYPPPLSFAMAAAQVAAGMAQVAQIRAQSFDGGGFTGRGSRSGGMDGKGGFPAILHPNETVVDHTKGQSGGITIVNNIDATGAGADVDMKIRAAMQQTSQQTILSIQDLMRRRRFG
jgi:hypothetical protein